MFIVRMPGVSADTSINSFCDNSGGTVLISSAAVVSRFEKLLQLWAKTFLVSLLTRLVVIQYDLLLPWLFIWLGLVLRQSCSWGDGEVTHSFVTFGNKFNNFLLVFLLEWFRGNISLQFQDFKSFFHFWPRSSLDVFLPFIHAISFIRYVTSWDLHGIDLPGHWNRVEALPRFFMLFCQFSYLQFYLATDPIR